VNETELRATVIEALHRIAPEAEAADLADDADLQEALDLDSMDFLNLMIAVQERTGIEVPEQDYPQVVTLGSCVAYLAARSAPG